MTKSNNYSQEERLLAAFAHGSIIANGIGIIGGVIIYLTQKEKSRFVAGQALQAAVYQLIGMIIVVLGWIGWTVLYMLTLIPIMNMPETAAPPPIFWVGLGSMICPLIFTGAWLLYGLYGGLRAYTGADFRYKFVGRFAEIE